jgi:hypothetical protein
MPQKSGRIGAFFLGLVFAGFFPRAALALNPIHESVYLAYPTGLSQGEPAMHAAAIVPGGGDSFLLPLGLSFALGRQFEVGAGIKTAWGNGGDAVTSWVLGLTASVDARTALGVHLLFDAQGGEPVGLTLLGHRRGGLSRRISTATDLRVGFLSGLAQHDAFMAFEGGYALRLRVTGPVSLHAGAVMSSQTRHFNDHFALDFEPGVHVGTGRNSALQAIITLGLAGERREGLRVKCGWVQGF